MDPYCVPQVIGIAASVQQVLNSSKGSGTALAELWQEIGSLQQTLKKAAAIRESPEDLQYFQNGAMSTLPVQYPHESSRLTEVLIALVELENWLKYVDSVSLATKEEAAQEWQKKIRKLKIQLLNPVSSNWSRNLLDSVHSFGHQSEPFQGIHQDIKPSNIFAQSSTLKSVNGFIDDQCAIDKYYDGKSSTGSQRRRSNEFAQERTVLQRLHTSTYCSSAIPGLFLVATSATTAVCIRKYDELRSHSRHDPLHEYIPLLLFLTEPSPSVFVAATLIHGLTTFGYYISRKDDRYRAWFLGTGTLAAVTTGIITGSDIQGILLSFLPLALIISLVLCAISNYVWYCCQCGEGSHVDSCAELWDEKSCVGSQFC
ncbi:hypothetical protein CC78DRAFT_616420 [Lojkania enalia]|uniref:Uncharacterized protein n=1 Tax=Lojkania enalia TaxID=147567 RepID=A0A9P4KAK9_9PLEO|nr:hypothetical protein CC78DRAFT_616420 [Didymosphaeria enalia]